MKTANFVVLLIVVALLGGAGGWGASAFTGKQASAGANSASKPQTSQQAGAAQTGARSGATQAAGQASGQSGTTQSGGQPGAAQSGGAGLLAAGGGTLGTVQKVEGNTITLAGRDGATTAVKVSDKTTIQKTVQGSLSDVVAGISITVLGSQQSDGSISAATVSLVAAAQALGQMAPGGLGADRGGAAGTVQKIDGKAITLTLRDGSAQKVVVSDSTSYQKMGQGSISDLAAGATIVVIGEKDGQGAIEATTITLAAVTQGATRSPGARNP